MKPTPPSHAPEGATSAKAKTTTVLSLLAAAAITFSYLGAFAIPTAMVHEGLLRPWPAGTDPRPKWMLIGFAFLMVLFSAAGGLLGWVSKRELTSIDAMTEE